MIWNLHLIIFAKIRCCDACSRLQWIMARCRVSWFFRNTKKRIVLIYLNRFGMVASEPVRIGKIHFARKKNTFGYSNYNWISGPFETREPLRWTVGVELLIAMPSSMIITRKELWQLLSKYCFRQYHEKRFSSYVLQTFVFKEKLNAIIYSKILFSWRWKGIQIFKERCRWFKTSWITIFQIFFFWSNGP